LIRQNRHTGIDFPGECAYTHPKREIACYAFFGLVSALAADDDRGVIRL
jgi:hypothetical protein